MAIPNYFAQSHKALQSSLAWPLSFDNPAKNQTTTKDQEELNNAINGLTSISLACRHFLAHMQDVRILDPQCRYAESVQMARAIYWHCMRPFSEAIGHFKRLILDHISFNEDDEKLYNSVVIPQEFFDLHAGTSNLISNVACAVEVLANLTMPKDSRLRWTFLKTQRSHALHQVNLSSRFLLKSLLYYIGTSPQYINRDLVARTICFSVSA